MSARTLLGRYRLDEEIGRGGAGIVWRGEDTLLQRPVAIKEVAPTQQRERVLREARAAARVSHPRLVTMFDVVEEDGHIFLVQELITGGSLREAITREGRLAPERVAEIGLQLLAALDVLHREGIVHRDVKPANVMLLPDGSAKLADLGIASVAGDPELTNTGIILGSPHFMAPEQASGERADGRTDLWSLGATLFHAVEGQPPYSGPAMAAMASIVNGPVPEPQHAGRLTPVIRRLMEKDPRARPTAAEARAMLTDEPTVTWADRGHDDTADDHQVVVTRTGAGTGWGWAAAIAVAIVLLFGALALAALPGGNDDDSTDDSTAATDAPTTTAAPSTTVQPTTTAPAGTETFTNDRAGYSIAYPTGWSVRERDRIVDFLEPGTGTYLRVDWTDEPGPSPQGAWERQEESFGKKDKYQRVQMEETTYQGYPASLWEYTYRNGGDDVHAYNLGFVTENRGFALNFQTSEQNWSGAQATWEQLTENFQVLPVDGNSGGNQDDDD